MFGAMKSAVLFHQLENGYPIFSSTKSAVLFQHDKKRLCSFAPYKISYSIAPNQKGYPVCLFVCLFFDAMKSTVLFSPFYRGVAQFSV